ncbi:DUF3237 domain-containing protein [[Clostridium] polysaccharolyticum]|uniref:Uncharacterized protein n=1 Tax=[Clostridium] polysaccharolyticum TaxID=29364 RepID=A0A1I0ABP6_9FIRM|nr:DUF3237 domain-containing protein [[Clostridium] polysaccharolyticum]SES90673.1 Protein of unknown function [[Clostridium] polysaccharolyticum]
MKEELIFSLRVECGPWMVIGQTDEGQLRVIPITGGEFTGKINGKIIPGGADWNTQRDESVSYAFAKYVIQTEDGFYISVENEGEIDDRKAAPFLTKPVFQVDKNSPYGWLNESKFIGKLGFGKAAGEVVIDIYRVSEMK